MNTENSSTFCVVNTTHVYVHYLQITIITFKSQNKTTYIHVRILEHDDIAVVYY